MMGTPLIVPTVLEEHYARIVARIESVARIVSRIQVDICDGRYTDHATWPFSNDEVSIARMHERGEMLPYAGDVEYEADLMVEDPASVLEHLVALGVTRAVLHAKAPRRAEEHLARVRARHGGTPSLSLGIAVTNDSFLPAWETALSSADFIQLMGIRKIGTQGSEPTDPRTRDTLVALARKGLGKQIQVDGAVGAEDVRPFLRAGADILVCGSAVFAQPEGPEAAYRRLDALATKAGLL